MPKKKKLQAKAPVPLTRGQLSKAQREHQQIRNLYTVGVAVLTIIVLVIAFALTSTFILKPNEQVASVNDVKITRATYNKVRRWDLFQQIRQVEFQSQTGTLSSDLQTQVDALTAQLRGVDAETQLDQTTISALIDSEVLRQKTKSELQISASQEDLKAAAVKDFVPEPTQPPGPVPTASATGGITGTATMTPTATLTFTPGPPTKTATITPTFLPVQGAQQTAEAGYTRFVQALGNSTAAQPGTAYCGDGCPSISEQDYLNLIIEPRVLQEKATDKLASTIVTQVEQIHAQHILTDTEAGAKLIIQRLDKGEDFTQLANTQSSEQIKNIQGGSQPNGGDLGWFPQEGSNFDKDFVAGAFKVATGQYSKEPVKTQFGYHIIKVLERDPKRPLDETTITSKKSTLYQDWLNKARDSSNIVPKPTPTPVPPTTAPLAPTPPPAQPTATTAAGAKPTQPITATTTITTGIPAATPTK